MVQSIIKMDKNKPDQSHLEKDRGFHDGSSVKGTTYAKWYQSIIISIPVIYFINIAFLKFNFTGVINAGLLLLGAFGLTMEILDKTSGNPRYIYVLISIIYICLFFYLPNPFWG